MREEWVFILSTCSVIVKLRGLWCDMTGDCFKCPHQWNGWACLGVTAKKLFTYITCRYLLCIVNSCESLPRRNEPVCVLVCVRQLMQNGLHSHLLGICVQADMQCSKAMCVNVCASATLTVCVWVFVLCVHFVYSLNTPAGCGALHRDEEDPPSVC